MTNRPMEGKSKAVPRTLGVLLLAFSLPLRAQPPGSDAAPSSSAGRLQSSAVAAEGERRDREQIAKELRESLRQQQEQMESLQKALLENRRLLERLEQTSEAEARPTEEARFQAAGKLSESAPSPLGFRIGAATFEPGGFIDFTEVVRSTNTRSGIGTAFGNIPLRTDADGKLNEFRSSAQNSRLSLLVTTQHGAKQITGYLESDFLGVSPPNFAVASNSHSLRLRQYWAEIRWRRWEVLGGQAWSLITPNRQGLSPRPADVFSTLDMDTNYQVGLTWGRRGQFRVMRQLSDRWAAGVSLEDPTLLTGNFVTLPPGTVGTDRGNGEISANLHPDIIVKAAYDSPWGHVEWGAFERTFEVANSLGGPRHHLAGGGGMLNMNLRLRPSLQLLMNNFGGVGGGRYIFGLGPDAVVRPDGSLSGVLSASTLAGLEYQASSQWSFFAYYGGAYFRRNFAAVPGSPGQFVGFGYPGSGRTHNKSIQEATWGSIYTFFKDPQYGALSLITQYSYLVRSLWSPDQPGNPSQAHTHMGYVNLRYTLP